MTALHSAHPNWKEPAQLMGIRFVYFIAAMVVVIGGLASRRFRGQLPAFLAEYAGDTLWALMLFLLVSMLLADRPILLRAAISLVFAFLVEISQLYHAPWIDSIRQTTPGGLVLGFGFVWADLICYSVGIVLGLLFDAAITGRIEHTKEA